jgi:hypothetical protein
MSTQTANRSGGGGGGRSKASKANSQQKDKQKENEAVINSANDSNTNSTKDKKTATEHVKPEKEKPQIKPTAEQIRIAQITDIKGGMEDPKIREKVEKLMEMTQRSEEDVCCALYECDNDLEKAVIFLLEQLPVNAFATTSKKKKNRQAASSDANTGDGDWNNENAAPNSGSKDNTDKDKSRNRQGGPGGSRSERGTGRSQRDGRGGGRRENDRNGASNFKDFKVDTFRADGDSRPRGGRGGFNSSRGRGGRPDNRDSGRSNYRGNRTNRGQGVEMQEIDSWEPSQGMSADQQKQEVQIDTWGDWDNEEYTGSLTDTKVFTPSTSTASHGVTSSQAPELSAPPGLEQQMLNPPVQQQTQVDSYSSAITQSQVTATGANQAQYPEIHSSTTAAQHLRQALEMPQITSATLSAEQSQYFNTLSSQNSNVNSYQTNTVQYQTNYGTPNQYVTGTDQVQQQAPQTRRPPARARVPPPSKIPSTAVEMPGDAVNNMGFLDVQFGGLDFGTDDSFENVTEKFSAASLETSQTIPNVSDVSDYQNKSATQKTMTGPTLQSSQILSNTDSLNSQTDSISSNYTQRNPSSVPAPASGAANYQMGKSDPYNQGSSNQATVYQSSSYVAQNKNPSYQSGQGYGSSSYSNTSQVSSNNNYPPASNNSYNSYNQSYQQQNSNTNAGVGSVSSVTSGVSNNNSNQSIPVNSSSVNNNNANTNTGYLSSQYPVNQTTYPSQPSGYQTNQSVYGNTGLTNSSGYSSSTNTTSGQYNNFSTSSKLKDTPVSTPFDSTSSTNVSSTVTSSSVTTSNMSSPSLGLTNTKVTNSTAKSGTTVVPNIPMVSQYIQTPGMPFYQPQVYSYEDMQMLQQRVSHVPGYYDLNYQAPTSLNATGVRDANLSSMAYSTMSDARFTRTDNNSSPVSNVPSTMSQQTGSGGPMLNLPYAYFYPNNAMMPGGYQFSTPAIYTQQMGTANATSGQQFPKPSYNSGYGSTSYDTLSQTTQDYNKAPYASSGVGQQSKGQTVSNPQSGTGSDITSSMYGKSHAALNKVNSYEKQSFHSGTPPPFNLVGSQTALNNVNAASAQPYGSQHLYIPTIAAPHHNMNMHQPHQDSSSTGQRQQTNSQGKSSTKQGYSPSYWAAQN